MSQKEENKEELEKYEKMLIKIGIEKKDDIQIKTPLFKKKKFEKIETELREEGQFSISKKIVV